ncbi:Unknown protein, partial [Striga hermonthica]
FPETLLTFFVLAPIYPYFSQLFLNVYDFALKHDRAMNLCYPHQIMVSCSKTSLSRDVAYIFRSCPYLPLFCLTFLNVYDFASKHDELINISYPHQIMVPCSKTSLSGDVAYIFHSCPYLPLFSSTFFKHVRFCIKTRWGDKYMLSNSNNGAVFENKSFWRRFLHFLVFPLFTLYSSTFLNVYNFSSKHDGVINICYPHQIIMPCSKTSLSGDVTYIFHSCPYLTLFSSNFLNVYNFASNHDGAINICYPHQIMVSYSKTSLSGDVAYIFRSCPYFVGTHEDLDMHKSRTNIQHKPMRSGSK